ncbi:MAG TPA: hypothetical protein PKD73_06070 [Burkholderiaceae bacterium]|nr:hypothetical protein [Burkholderiaceae bacterium]
MSVNPAAIAALPAPGQAGQTVQQFNAAQSAFCAALTPFGAQVNAAGQTTYQNALAATDAATASATAQSAAQAAAAAAIATAGVADFSAATVYASGARARSLSDRQVYRRLSAGQAATDPASDSATWMPAGIDISTGQPSLRPAMLLDFAGSRGIDPRITVTRASEATRRNALGLIERVSAGAPRVDYDPRGQCQGLLVERPSSNFWQSCCDPSAAWWVKVRCAASVSTVPAPDGGSAFKITEDSSADWHGVASQVVPWTNSWATLSIYVHTAGRSQVVIHFFNTTTHACTACFDLAGRTVVSLTPGNAEFSDAQAAIEDAGRGWVRISLSAYKAAVSASLAAHVMLASGNSYVYAGDGASGLLLWGAQLEDKPEPTSIIITAAATASRATETVGMAVASPHDALSFFAEATCAPTRASADAEGFLLTLFSPVNDGLRFRGVRSTPAMYVDGFTLKSSLAINDSINVPMTAGMPVRYAGTYGPGATSLAINGALLISGAAAGMTPSTHFTALRNNLWNR